MLLFTGLSAFKGMGQRWIGDESRVRQFFSQECQHTSLLASIMAARCGLAGRDFQGANLVMGVMQFVIEASRAVGDKIQLGGLGWQQL